MKFRKIMLTAVIAQLSTPSFAEEAKMCEGDRGALSGDSWIYAQPLPNQGERELPKQQFTLWGLPELNDKLGTLTIQEVVQESALSIESSDGIDTVRFASGQHDVHQRYANQLDAVLKSLSDQKNVSVKIIGHTDSQKLSANARKRYQDNYELGLFRTHQVGSFFIDTLGLSPDVISYDSKGPDQPIASNSTLEGMALNRRVEVQVWYDEVTNHQQQIAESLCAEPQAGIAGPFSISIDGKPQSQGVGANNADLQRCTDIALASDNIQVQYDNLSQPPRLSIAASAGAVTVNQPVMFKAYSNYRFWIERAEVIILDEDANNIATVLLDEQLAGEWLITKQLSRHLYYQLRVYDAEGRYDETRISSLRVRGNDNEKSETQQQMDSELALLAAYGENHLSRHSIPVAGGVVTVNGKHIAAEHSVFVMGKQIPVSADNSFVAQQIIPRGLHTVEVAVLDGQGIGNVFRRDLRLPEGDWFTVALADLTTGSNETNGPALAMNDEDHHYDEDSFVDGRLAFYTKGETEGGYTITASADTGEEEFSDLFDNIDEKNSRELLRRMDAKRHWPVFGDDSTLEEDAPTKGKFYARIDKDHSHAMWGNFKEQQNDTELTQFDRALYGAQMHYAGDQFTASGEHRLQVDAVAAEPGTLSAREDFRGTGGSVFFLRHQDITLGSERIQVEVRDKDSGLVLEVSHLSYGDDYQIDSIQGRVLLNKPLSSVASNDLVVRSSTLSGHPAYLVVAYEYTPGVIELSDLTTAGRVAYWLNDTVKVGASGSYQKEMDDTQDLAGVDLTLRKNKNTWLKAEVANSEGAGQAQHSSDDGGFGFNEVDRGGADANAVRIETAFKVSDLLGGEESEAKGTLYIEKRENGFSAPGRLTDGETEKFGGSYAAPLSEDTSFAIKFDDSSVEQGNELTAAEIDLSHQLNDSLSISAGLRADDRDGSAVDSGAREDLTLQLGYASEEKWDVWGFTQSTLHRSEQRDRNNRRGIGGRYQANRAELHGEVSDGDTGFGAVAGVDYQLSDKTNIYTNYQLNNDRTNDGIRSRNGQLVSGVRSRWSDSVSVYTEGRRQTGNQTGLMQAYGVDYSPADKWSYGLSTEHGDLNAETDGAIERLAIAASVGYHNEGYRYSGSLEYRDDESDLEDRTLWLTRNNFSAQTSDDWRAIVGFDMSISESDRGDVYDGDFLEASLGYAYRPVESDWLNALVKYTYLYDLAPEEQLNPSDVNTVDYAQRSQVFSADVTADISSRWSIGGKYAYRIGELRMSRDDSAEWFESKGNLLVIRADWHVVHAWDATIEWRRRNEITAEDSRDGHLLALYRHFGQYLKLGVGYNYSDFSDDLTDMDYDAEGFFVNMIGKY